MSTQNATSCSDFGISGSVEQRERRAASPGGASDLSGANGRTAQNGRRPEPAVTLSAGDVEAIAEATARKLVEFVGERGKTFGLVGPRELAEGLGVSLDYVYAHATELGAMRLGSGRRPGSASTSTGRANRSRPDERNGQAKAVALVARAAARAGPDRLTEIPTTRAKNHRNVVTRPESDDGARATMGSRVRALGPLEHPGLQNHSLVLHAAAASRETRLMPRPNTGQVFEKRWADGETVSYGARVRAYGRREKVTFGTNKQGWNRTRAELETREDRAADRARHLGPASARAARGSSARTRWRSSACRSTRPSGSSPSAGGAQSSCGIDENTVNDYEWRLGYLERFFGRYRAQRDHVAPRRPLPRRAARAGRDDPRAQERAERQSARPLIETVTDKRGPHLRAPAPAALEHLDQRDDHAARPDPAAGRRLRADRPQPGARGRALGPVPPAGHGRSERSSRSTSSTRCSTPPASSMPRRERTVKGLGRRAMVATLGLGRLSHQRDAGSARSPTSTSLAAASSSPTPRPRPACGRSR